MDFTNYGKEIQAQIEEMMELRYKRGEPYMESCRRLVDVGKHWVIHRIVGGFYGEK